MIFLRRILRHAFLANSPENDIVPLKREAFARRGGVLHLFLIRKRRILHSAATLAYGVVMRRRGCVESLSPVRYKNPPQYAGSGEIMQVTVHGSPAYVWVFSNNNLINLFGAWMAEALRRLQNKTLLDGFSNQRYTSLLIINVIKDTLLKI
jgi:hypothetical protein